MYTEREQEEYMKVWFSLAEEASRNGFTWPSLLENEEWNQYMATGMYRMPAKLILLSQKRQKKSCMCYRTYQYIVNTTEDFQKLGFPAEAWKWRE